LTAPIILTLMALNAIAQALNSFGWPWAGSFGVLFFGLVLYLAFSAAQLIFAVLRRASLPPVT